MKQLLNTLYITTPESYLSLDGENVVINKADEVVARVPLHNLNSIVCFCYSGATPALMGACAERGIGLCFLTPHGKFLARIEGKVQGNVLLRTTQYAWALNTNNYLAISKMFLTGKIYNAMKSLERTKRDHPMRVDIDLLDASVKQMKDSIVLISKAESRDQLMGLEGEAAQAYFRAFPQLILKNEEYFIFKGRNRRPPLDPVNAMLSFAYTLLGNEIAGALETVGLDPSVGFLHTLRPGRYSLALDILEELRAPFADRFVLNMINLGQVTYRDFERKENGAFYLNDNARKNFLAAWQKKKQEIITHPYLKEKIAWGIVPYAQAMLLARYVRGDLDAYPPFLWR